MLDVFFSVDVEVWCDGWSNLDEKFPDAFRRYVYGPTARGNFGLPYTLQVLSEHGLKGVFFVEPLFSTRFGRQPLEEIVGLIREGGQEIQLHLHPEWVDESVEPLLENIERKRQHLRYFTRAEQEILIGAGKRMITQAGGGTCTAFRAGSFGFNRDTLVALAANHIPFDSSYNASIFGLDSGVASGEIMVDTFICDGVSEYPMTVYDDGIFSLRHTQLTACSHREMEGLLWQALESGRRSFMILSHNFELLNMAKDRPDDVVVARFLNLCSFLDRNRDSFNVRGFEDLSPSLATLQPAPLKSPAWKSVARMLEQASRRRYR
jgi:hypothetical protein